MIKKSAGVLQRILNIIEKAGNALPHPATLFLIFALIALIVSLIGHLAGWQVIHPGKGETVVVNNLLSVKGLHYILLNTVSNFTGFAPLGIVLVAMLGIGIAENSGLIGGRMGDKVYEIVNFADGQLDLLWIRDAVSAEVGETDVEFVIHLVEDLKRLELMSY